LESLSRIAALLHRRYRRSDLNSHPVKKALRYPGTWTTATVQPGKPASNTSCGRGYRFTCQQQNVGRNDNEDRVAGGRLRLPLPRRPASLAVNEDPGPIARGIQAVTWSLFATQPLMRVDDGGRDEILLCWRAPPESARSPR
jgi:hypothetical protein